jgi:hypothetical protein
MPHVGRWALIVGLSAVAVMVLALGLLVGVSTVGGPGTPQVAEFQMSDLHLDSVAPMAPTTWLPEGTLTGGGWGSDPASGGTSVDDTIARPLSNWTDVRFEAWHALPMDEPGPGGIDTRYSAPFAVQSAVLSGNDLTAVFHFERLRDAGWWWVVLTAVGPDGHRYRLDNGGGGESYFSGSAWDWLTAPQ